MNSYRNLWLKHLWVCVSVLGLAGCGESSLSFRAVDGVLDLREWDITTQPKVPLAGEWAYRWGELLSPQRIQSNLHAPLEATINVPEFWNGLPDPYQADKVLSSHGHMTLVLRVLLPKGISAAELGLLLRGTNSSSSLFAVTSDGIEKVVEHGKVATSLAESVPEWAIRYGEFSAPRDEVLTLVWHVSNYHHHYGGTWRMPTLGKYSVVRGDVERDKYLLAGMIGIFLMMGLYHLGLFVQRRRRDTTLWFALLCFSFALGVASFNYFFFLESWEPGLNKFVVIVKMITLAPLVASAFLVLYFASAIPSPWFGRYAHHCCLGLVLLGIPSVLEKPDELAGSLSAVSVLLALLLCPLVVHLFNAMRKNDRDARLLVVAIASVVVGGVIDFMASFGFQIFDFAAASGLGMTVFVFVQSHLLASRFSDALDTAEHLTYNLQEEVQTRTKALEIKTLEAMEATEESRAAQVMSEGLRHQAELQAHELSVTLAELKKAQERLVIQARMAALGNVAAGVAHEVRNPLTLTLGGVDDLRERLEVIRAALPSGQFPDKVKQEVAAELDATEGLVDLIERGGERIEGIVDNLSNFVDSGIMPSRGRCHVASHVEVVTSLLARPVHDKHISIESRIDEGLEVWMNQTELNQILMNVLLNACQAVSEQGRINIVAELNESMVEIRIADDGPGIEPDVREHIFDPFFTTKEAGEGTGLGLSICHTMITNSKGDFFLGDSDNEGAEFVIRLPRATGESRS